MSQAKYTINCTHDMELQLPLYNTKADAIIDCNKLNKDNPTKHFIIKVMFNNKPIFKKNDCAMKTYTKSRIGQLRCLYIKCHNMLFADFDVSKFTLGSHSRLKLKLDCVESILYTNYNKRIIND